MNVHERAIKAKYELYTIMEGCDEAAKKLDDAVVKASTLVLPLVNQGLTIQQAIEKALTECVRPVIDGELLEFGAGDTEPEWRVADVIVFLTEQKLGIDLKDKINMWDLRFAM